MAGADDKGKSGADKKQQRLAEALRANLHRRKAQSRARAEEPPKGDIPDGKEGGEGPEGSSA